MQTRRFFLKSSGLTLVSFGVAPRVFLRSAAAAQGAARKKTLVVLDKPSAATLKSARNVAGVRLTAADKINTYDVVWADKIVVTNDALRRMEEVYAS